MSPATRKCPSKSTELGMMRKYIKRMMLVEIIRIGFIGREDQNFRDEIKVPKILHIKSYGFNNFRRKHPTHSEQLCTNYWQSISKYAEMITLTRRVVTLQDVREDRATDSEIFFFSLSTNRQVELQLKYNSLVFLGCHT